MSKSTGLKFTESTFELFLNVHSFISQYLALWLQPYLQISNAIALDQIAAIFTFLVLGYTRWHFCAPRSYSQIHLQLWLSSVLASDGALDEAVWSGLWSVNGSILAGVLESVVEAQV